MELFNKENSFATNINSVSSLYESMLLSEKMSDNHFSILMNEAISNEKFIVKESSVGDETSNERSSINFKKWIEELKKWLIKKFNMVKEFFRKVYMNLFDASFQLKKFYAYHSRNKAFKDMKEVSIKTGPLIEFSVENGEPTVYFKVADAVRAFRRGQTIIFSEKTINQAKDKEGEIIGTSVMTEPFTLNAETLSTVVKDTKDKYRSAERDLKNLERELKRSDESNVDAIIEKKDIVQENIRHLSNHILVLAKMTQSSGVVLKAMAKEYLDAETKEAEENA